MDGESILEASIVENKMAESVSSSASLEPSVSFGRFENDSLSWEKWSTFSPNKYLEEVEKCSTPGSVAQKRAYFEAHYKKIAARKAAEQLEQEKLMESASLGLDERKSENHVEDDTGNYSDFHVCNGERSTEEFKQEADVGRVITCSMVDDVEDNTGIDSEFCVCNGERSTEEIKQEEVVGSGSGSVVNSSMFDDVKDNVVGVGECQSSLVEDIKQEPSGSQSTNATESSDGHKIALFEEGHTSQKRFSDVKQTLEVGSEHKKAPEGKNKNLKVKAQNITQKKAPTKKDQALSRTKKKVASPAIKSSPISAPRLSRPAATSALASASQSSSKKSNGTLLPSNRNTPARGTRRAAPTSLHMSLSLGLADSSVSPASTRKSLIMEQMADKDIIKRAFKAFQNNYGQLRSSADDKFNGVGKVSSEVPQQKVSPLSPHQENEGLRKATDKKTAQRGQLETKSRSPGS